MAAAFKCDRCKLLYEGKPTSNISLSEGKYEDEDDDNRYGSLCMALCLQCDRDIRHTIQTVVVKAK